MSQISEGESELAQTDINKRSLRDTFQPSLWDRLVDDSSGLSAEIEGRIHNLLAELGADRLSELEQLGPSGLYAAEDLSDEQKKYLSQLFLKKRQQASLDERGIVVNSDVLREAVRRDLEALFNTERLQADYLLTDTEYDFIENNLIDLGEFPQVATSVVNYGVPAFSGKSAGGAGRDKLATEIKALVAVFEPRLREDSIKVRVNSDPTEGLKIDIDAVLIMTPSPERLIFRTSIDLENGQATTELDDQ